MIVEDDRNLAIHQRQLHGLAVQVEVALVLGVDRDGSIAEHRFGTRRGDHQLRPLPIDRIADVPQVALRLLVVDFEIGDRGVAAAGTS